MAQTSGPGQPKPQVERSATVLETDEAIRQALLSGLKSPQKIAPVEPTAAHMPAPSSGRAVSPFRPTARPVVPILTVYDDGKTEGEIIRIREPRYTIGRTEGDLRFPLDGRMSSRHIEITHQVIGGLHRWVVTDLQSANGMFVRVGKTPLVDKAEFLVGNGRYQLDANQPDPDTASDPFVAGPNTGETHGWDDGPGPIRPPALTELLGREIGNRILLVRNEYWIGSDPACAICRPDDPFCEPRHVRVFRGSKGGWHAEHNKTHNGLWLRMPQYNVETMIQFQIGEQRFNLKVS